MLRNRVAPRLWCIKEGGAGERSVQNHVFWHDPNDHLNITHETIDEFDTMPVKRLNEDSILRDFSFIANGNKAAPNVGSVPDKDSSDTL